MLSKFTVTILNSFFRPPPSNNNINFINYPQKTDPFVVADSLKAGERKHIRIQKMLNPPPNYSEDNDFLLDVYRLPDDSVLYWRIIAYDLRSDFIWNISKRDSRLQTWQKYVLNSDLAVFESACTIPSSIDLYVSQNLVEKSANTVCLTLDFHVNKAVESASIIFVLPEGFRPRQTLFVPVLDVTTNTPNTYATIEPNGNISVASNIQTGFFAIIQKTFMV